MWCRDYSVCLSYCYFDIPFCEILFSMLVCGFGASHSFWRMRRSVCCQTVTASSREGNSSLLTSSSQIIAQWSRGLFPGLWCKYFSSIRAMLFSPPQSKSLGLVSSSLFCAVQDRVYVTSLILSRILL